MELSTVAAAPAVEIEQIEIDAWSDMYQAIPEEYRAQFNPEILERDGVVFTRCAAIPFMHFNSVHNLGLGRPATEEELDAIIARYDEIGAKTVLVLHNPHCQPAGLPEWLEARGLALRGGWDRAYRPAGSFNAPETPAPDMSGAVELVTEETAAEWAGFLDRVYGLPTGPWLRNFACRKGWTHAMLRHDGNVIAVRSMFTNADGWAWFCVEAPVPGIMAPTFAEDHALVYALLRKGLEQGAHTFTADVEAPSSGRDTIAYRNWESLGFTFPYMRNLYMR